MAPGDTAGGHTASVARCAGLQTHLLAVHKLLVILQTGLSTSFNTVELTVRLSARGVGLAVLSSYASLLSLKFLTVVQTTVQQVCPKYANTTDTAVIHILKVCHYWLHKESFKTESQVPPLSTLCFPCMGQRISKQCSM